MLALFKVHVSCCSCTYHLIVALEMKCLFFVCKVQMKREMIQRIDNIDKYSKTHYGCTAHEEIIVNHMSKIHGVAIQKSQKLTRMNETRDGFKAQK
jgi:hypothetical protein